jgi:molecular chaperone DnaK
MAEGEKIIGIDLGTTNSVVAVMEGGEAKVIQNAEGDRLTPSVVAFTEDGERVGVPAKRQAVTNPRRTIYSIKRFMGRRHNEVHAVEKMVPYEVVGGADEYVKVKINDKTFTPAEISARVLGKLKQAAESYLGHKVNKAVITVPAYFNDAQRQATKDAGQIAGLQVERIINEPTAAALAYGLDKKDKDQKIAVFDLGGGTFDISILDVGGGVFQVISTNGDTKLGGDDFDEALINFVADKFLAEHKIDLRKDTSSLQRLQEACEKAKKELSSVTQTDINLPFITVKDGQPMHLNYSISRAEFERIVDHLVENCRKPVVQALDDAKLKPGDIDEVVLVGGSTRIPKIQEMVKKLFNREPHKGVNPDEVVAIGAAIQGGILAGEVSDVLLVDVTPLSLGIETLGGVMDRVIERNTTIPTDVTKTYSTADDNQTTVTVKVYQGERPMAADNRLLGQFDLTGIPPAPRGMPQVEVKFDIDRNGILNVTARDKATNKEHKIEIKAASGLSEAEIEKMRRDAAEHAEEDKRKRELADARNSADQIAFETEKLVKEHGEKLSESDKTAIESAVAAVKTAKAGEDIGAIKSAMSNLEQATHALSRVLYEQAGANAGAGGPQGGPEGAAPADEDTIDAEFEVKKD